MGGYGSGRWSGHWKKTTVEECLTLTMHRLVRDGTVARSSGAGTLIWTNTQTGERTANLGYRREVSGNVVTLTLSYTVTRPSGERIEVEEPIVLQTTMSAVGGMRWWFTCPLTANGRPCRRRTGKLYLPSASRYFGCRLCYDLTYASCQESHKYDRLFRTLARETGFDEAVVKAAMSRGT